MISLFIGISDRSQLLLLVILRSGSIEFIVRIVNDFVFLGVSRFAIAAVIL